MSFTATLNQLMKDTGVSNVALGKAVGVSDVSVMKWKKGEAQPSLENAVSIARYFGISVDDLAGVKLSFSGTSRHTVSRPARQSKSISTALRTSNRMTRSGCAWTGLLSHGQVCALYCAGSAMRQG